MSSTVSSTEIQPELTQEPRPLNASYGKLMMWFFIVSDALTFTGFLIAYGFSRFKNIDSWPIADEVFTHFPGSFRATTSAKTIDDEMAILTRRL